MPGKNRGTWRRKTKIVKVSGTLPASAKLTDVPTKGAVQGVANIVANAP